jgi:hypothetical protein
MQNFESGKVLFDKAIAAEFLLIDRSTDESD